MGHIYNLLIFNIKDSFVKISFDHSVKNFDRPGHGLRAQLLNNLRILMFRGIGLFVSQGDNSYFQLGPYDFSIPQHEFI